MGLEQAQFAGASDGFGAAFGLQFGEDAQVVPLDRAQRDDQFLSDLLVGKPLRNETQHFKFAFAQWIDQMSKVESGKRKVFISLFAMIIRKKSKTLQLFIVDIKS